MNINSLSVVKYHKRKRRKYELFVYISGAIICIAFIKFMHWNANRLQIPSVLPERIKDAWIASIIFTGLTFFILWAGIRFMVWKKCSYHKVLPQLSHERLMEIESDTQQSGIHAHLIKLYSGSRHESPPYTTLLLAVYGRVLFYQNGF